MNQVQKIYLSSLSIPNEQAFKQLFEKTQSNRIAIIPNAGDVYPKEKSLPYVEALCVRLKSMGFEPIILDLLEYKDRRDDLKKTLRNFQGVWIMGGNTFYLNWAIQQSSFHKLIIELIKNGLVYGGESAGAVIAGRTLHGIENIDDSNLAPEVIWDGLGLVDYGIIPHWGNEKYIEVLDKCAIDMAQYATVKTLGDSDYILTS
ncbi:MAG: Type 1 glutamine amidotransferase-like domain-containing protein [Patescibacteria group bacterium]|nr:Type 1 glutamine amidotransferase-like domain-containing protein [Patescibacteria group bacterium]